MESLADIGGWISENEALLSGIAAMIVVAGVIFTPFGVGLRRLLGARGATASAAAPSVSDRAPVAEPAPTREALAPPSDKPSIAVLPFANMSADAEQEFLADGMTEDIITGLAANRHLLVVSRNSTFAYKGKSPDIRDVGRELGVRYVLEGSVRRVGEKLRTTVQLIETGSGSHLWAEKYDRAYAEMFDVQDEVIARIGGALVAQLSSAEYERSTRATPANLGAWELVQRGIFGSLNNSPVLRHSDSSIASLRAAVELDPHYAYARAALGWILFMSVINGWASDVEGNLREGEGNVKAALDLGGTEDPLVAFYIGAAYVYSGRHERALRVLEKSLARNPQQPDAMMHAGIANGYLENFAAAHEWFDRAEEMAPTGGMAVAHTWYRAIVLMFEDRFEEAIALLEEFVQRAPRYAAPRVMLGLSFAAVGRMDDAKASMERAAREDPGLNLEGLSLFVSAHPDAAIGRERDTLLRAYWPSSES